MGKFKVKNEVKGEWYTEKQLNEMGMVLKRGAKGVTMYTNGFYQYAADYYTLKQARKDEGKAKAIISNNRKQQRKARKEEKESEMRILEAQTDEAEMWHTAHQWLELGRIPDDKAIWRTGKSLLGKSESYYYCRIDDTHEPAMDEIERVKADQERKYHYQTFVQLDCMLVFVLP